MLLVLEIFRTSAFLATHSDTNSSSLLSVAVISVAVVVDVYGIAVIYVAVVAYVYSVESSTYIDTLPLLKASRISLVKNEKSKGPKQLP